MDIMCEHCGRYFGEKDIIISVKEGCDISFFCRECNSLFGHCPMCQHNTECGFLQDPDPMPQFRTVSRTVQQGNVTFMEQCQIPNAERIKKFCIDRKCKCFLNDPEHPLCCRFGGYTTCTNYCEMDPRKFVQDFSQTEANEN